MFTVKDVKELIKDLDDDVELYYPHYYKGYGLKPVNKIKKGKIQDKDVLVLDWDSLLVED